MAAGSPEDDPSLAAQKQRLRQAFRASRKAARARSPDAEDAMRRHFEASGLAEGVADIAAFLPIGSELDPMRILAGFAGRLALPVMVAKDRPLIFRAYTPVDDLVERGWGIREPVADAPEIVPDLVLVPLLAVDADGYRLGYGGGFYDRTLTVLRETRPVTAIGLAFDEQFTETVPRGPYDVPVDWVLTPSGLTECGAASKT